MTRDPATEVLLDFDRRRRIGLDESIFAEGKSVDQLQVICLRAKERHASLLITRLSPEKYAALQSDWSERLNYCAHSKTAFFGATRPAKTPARVAIVAAGSSDAGVAREAERTLEFSGIASELFFDVGVAGLWRLSSRIDAISRYPVIIAVAGMDAALPTVLGGLVGSMIIAVPTSVGYGVAVGGHAALNSILASCAPGITTVNIDNGYGAACAAMRALAAFTPSTCEEQHQWKDATLSNQVSPE